MMKKNYVALFLAFCAGTGLFAQSGPVDIILLLDTSASMSASYQEVNRYISGGFLKEFLRTGDTFHLIPFSDKPRLDLARRVEGRGDIETIIGRMFLQYPLDPWSDIPAALSFVEQYSAGLPQRPKKIVLVSDGNTLLPPGSTPEKLDSAALNNLISGYKNRLGRQNITLEFVQVTPGAALSNLPSSGRAARPPQITPPPVRQEPPAAPLQSAPQPPPARAEQPVPAAPSAPIPVTPPPGSPPAQIPPVQSPPIARPVTPVQTPPHSPALSAPPPVVPPPAEAARPLADITPPSEPPPPVMMPPAEAARPLADITPPPELADNVPKPELEPEEITPVEPVAPIDPVELPELTQPVLPEPVRPAPPPREAPAFNREGLPLAMFIGLGILALFVIGLIMFLASRRLQKSPNRAIAQAAVPRRVESQEESTEPRFADHSKDLAKYASVHPKPRQTPYQDYRPPAAPHLIDNSRPVMLNLFVEDQNTFIGKRNIHSLKPGYSLTIGGGNSDFLVFLVPIPPHIGEIRRDGSRCTFIPRKPKYFPDLGARELPDCIGKTIRVMSEKNYELRFRLEPYEDPLAALNRLLNSLKVPGGLPAR
jgi:hypothetical protein